MAILIRQELYKLFMRKKTLVVLVGFILLTGFLAYGIKEDTENMKLYNSPEYQIENMQSNLNYLEVDKNNIPDDIKNDKEKVNKYKEDLDEQITSLKEEIASLKGKVGKDVNWRENLQTEIVNIEQNIVENGSSATPGELAQWNIDVDQLKYFQQQDIKPQEYDFNGFMYMNKLVESLGQIFLIIGIAVFAADMVSGEWTPPTLKSLLAQPVSRGKVIFSKYIAIVLASVGLILLVEIISFIIVGLIFGFGDSVYPTIVGMKYQLDTGIILEGGTALSLIDSSATIIPIWKYTIQLLLTQGLFIISTTSFVFLISTLVKSSMVSMGTSVVSLVVTTIIFQISSLQKIAMLVFTSYWPSGDMITGNIAMIYKNPQVTGSLGVLVLVIWTVICYLISHIFFVKRDILI